MSDIARTVQGYPARPADYVPRGVLGIQLLARWKNEPEPAETLWLRRLVGALFQSFRTLHLPGQPAAEMLPHTAQLWVDVLLDMNLTEADTERIQAAGRRLLRDLEDWPQPRTLIAVLPRRSPPPSDLCAASEPAEADRAAGKEALAKLREMF